MPYGEINTDYVTHYITYYFENTIMNLAIIYRKIGKNKDNLSTHKCPFCNKTHSHGILEGHRVTHCTGNDKKPKIIELENGIILNSNDGYYVKNY